MELVIRFLAASALVAGCVATGGDDRKGSVAEEIDALVRETNARKTLHLFYGNESSADDSSSLEVVYRSPDEGHLVLQRQGERREIWIDGKTMYVSSTEAGEDGKWRKITFPERSESAELLDELFPLDSAPIEPGVYLGFAWNRERDRPELSIGITPLHRYCLVGWLTEMQWDPESVSIEGDELVWADDERRIRVSRETGMMLHARSDTDGTALVLRECRLDEPLDPARITIPAGLEDSEADPELPRYLQQRSLSTRGIGFLRVEQQVRSRREWNDATCADWRAFLRSVHRELLLLRAPGWREPYDEHADRLATWVGEQRREDRSFERLAEVEGVVKRAQEVTAARLATSRISYLESLPPAASRGIAPRKAIFDAEREVVAELWNELVVEPVMDGYDDRLDAVLRP